ncbi:MAG TPA: hypothetical protein DCY13_01880 [Verrucomicrobiales bacterium]|nr:hypothetical protein [Verrucomicrobiales bacterium]
MRCNTDHLVRLNRTSRAAFTLAEVLAALAFMAIVIPVAVQGIQVANRAGLVAARKGEAMRIAERVVNELDVTGLLLAGSQNGVVEEGVREFRWRMQSQPWLYGDLDEVWVNVTFEVQGREYEVRLATLVDPDAATAISTTETEVAE